MLLIDGFALASGERAERIAALLAQVEAFDCLVFVSGNAVQEFLLWCDRLGIDPLGLPPALAVGRATGDALLAAGIRVEAAGGSMNSEALLALPRLANPEGRRVLLCRGEGGRTLLADTLTERGARLEELPLYRRLPPRISAERLRALLDDARINAVQAGSGETLANLLNLLGPEATGRISDAPLLLPSDRVAELARSAGWRRIRVCPDPTDDGIIAALRELETP